MIDRIAVKAAVERIDTFIAELGDSPMGGQHLAAKEWQRARGVILEELRHRDEQVKS